MALKQFAFSYVNTPTPDRPDDDIIIRLTELVLDLTAFGFNNKFYRHKKGVAMGTKMGPSYACLFMGYLETRILTNCGDNKPLLVRRYIDDFFGIATSSEEEVKNFIGKFNTFHPSIKVTHEISSSCITFLDINVSLKDTGVSTSVHYKPTDSHAVPELHIIAPTVMQTIYPVLSVHTNPQTVQRRGRLQVPSGQYVWILHTTWVS